MTTTTSPDASHDSLASSPSSSTPGETIKAKKSKLPPAGLVIPPPRPKMTKAERRALQDQQRAAKAEGRPRQGGADAIGSGGSGNYATASKTGSLVLDKQASGTSNKPPATTAASSSSFGNLQGKPEGKGGGPGGLSAAATTATTSSPKTVAAIVSTGPSFVSHLQPYPAVQERWEFFGAQIRPRITTYQNLHPCVLQTGYAYATGQIRGGNARCRAMLHCYQTLLEDFVVPTERESLSSMTQPHATDRSLLMTSNANSATSTDLRAVLDHLLFKPAFTFWTEQCRPHSVSMGNAFSFLKTAVASLDRDLTWSNMKRILLDTIAQYEQERMDWADQAIAELACQKLLVSSTARKKAVSEVLLVYGYSEVVAAVLLQATTHKVDFRVIVVDSHPLCEGRRMLHLLRHHNHQEAPIPCSYVFLHALPYVMQDVTKVLLGASALMSDGSVYGRIGTACVAMTAHTQHIPVLVCSETYKISNRVQLESITHNEIGNASFGGNNAHSTSKHAGTLDELHLLYDLTPATFVTGIITELGIIPPSSVAVLLREMNLQQQPPAAPSSN